MTNKQKIKMFTEKINMAGNPKKWKKLKMDVDQSSEKTSSL